MTTETEDPRKAALLAEAKELKVPHDANWSADQLEKVVAKKRATIAAAAKPAEPEPATPPAAVEGDDAEVDAFADERAELKQTIEALVAERDAAKAQAEVLAEKLKISNETVFDLEAAKSKAESDLFDLQLKLEGGVEKPRTTEDFGGPKETVAQAEPKVMKPTASGTITCKVTKAGDGKIFKGKDKEMFARGDVFDAQPDTAASLEAKGWVETD